LFLRGNFLNSRRPKTLAADALARLFAASDKTRQSVYAAVVRSTIEGGVIDARVASFVLGH
jgi:hypothetical protein